jgi:hypothetical protein
MVYPSSPHHHHKWSSNSLSQGAVSVAVAVAVAIRRLLVRPTTMPITLIIMVFVAGISVGSLFRIDPITTSFMLTRRQLIDHHHSIDQLSTLSYQTNIIHDGWHTIHVFSGKNRGSATAKQLSIPTQQQQQQQQVYFAQARQDEVVLSLLRNQTNGYFVDLAANDATVLSNTYALETHFGWKGLCVSYCLGRELL